MNVFRSSVFVHVVSDSCEGSESEAKIAKVVVYLLFFLIVSLFFCLLFLGDDRCVFGAKTTTTGGEETELCVGLNDSSVPSSEVLNSAIREDE